MCEIFGVSSEKEINADKMLKEFFSHSEEHRQGWGIALFDGFSVSVEREPIKASASTYLKNRLTGGFNVSKMLAHIRRATTGYAEYNNTHPFVKRDNSGRSWTLVHNGHIFNAPFLHKYLKLQKGTTDSERVLLYIVDQVNSEILYELSYFDVNLRFETIEKAFRILSKGNKLNLLLYDGEYMYVHNNEDNSLYIKNVYSADGKTALFSTKPLQNGGWEPIPKNKLFVYSNGKMIYEGKEHENTYISDPEKEKSLYLGFSGL